MIEHYENETENQVSLADYLRILYRGRWLIASSFLVVLSATILYTFTTAPTYQASVTIIIESTGAMERSFFDFSYLGNQNTMIANQMEILKSRSVAERVIKRLNLSEVRDSLKIFQPNELGEYLSFRTMVEVLQNSMEVEHKRDTDIITLTCSAGSPFEAAYLANTIADEFQQQNVEANKSEVTELRQFLEGQVSRKYVDLTNSEEALRNYQETQKVASLDQETSELVSRLAQVESELESARVTLQAKLEQKSSLQEKLEERKQSLPKDLSEISTPYLQSLQEQLAQVVADRTVYVTAVESEAQTTNKAFYQQSIKQYDDRIAALKEKLQEEANKITAASMVTNPLQLSQDIVIKLLTLDGEIKAETAKINALQEVLVTYNARLENLPEKVLELARLERRRQVDEQTYLLMTQKLEETKIQENAQARNVRIIDKALAPLAPVSPKKKLNLMLGALIGIGLGVGLTFLIEYFDTSVKTHEELERMGFNILSAIPRIQMEKVEKKMESRLNKLASSEGYKIESRLITHLDPKSPVSEAYRTFRTNLQFSKVDRALNTLLITSAGPKEGKSTTAANLAIAMAQTGKKVLLVDADLRRPVIHSIFGLSKDQGITNFLMESLPYSRLVQPSFLENLSIVASGILPPNPSELLASKKMENLISRWQGDYDIIIIDSPPVIAVTDAAVLSTKVDGTILVVAAGQTDKEAVQRAQSLLTSVDANLLGVLLNNVDVEGTYGSYYYYYYHHYYSKPGQKKKRKKTGLFLL